MRAVFTILKLLLVVLISMAASLTSYGQLSSNTVGYKVTYDPATSRYTVWVVPQYSTPNANNAAANEFGATAQVTVKVPSNFVIQSIVDVKGVWEKNPLKLGDPVTQPAFNSQTYDKNYRYYTIGKTNEETDYGPFVSGTPVALFTFLGNFCAGAVGILPKGDAYVTAAMNAYFLNTESSFYSRSGQPAGGNIAPREQFVDKLGPDAACPPVAENDVATAVNPGATSSVNVLANDLLSNSTTPVPPFVTVDLDQATAGVQTALVVPGQGTWNYTPSTGVVTFTPIAGYTVAPTPITYTLTEISTGLTDDATITAPYNLLPPTAVNDVIAALNPGLNASFNLLTNDLLSDGSPATLSKVTVDLNPGTAGIQTAFTVAGQGTWTYVAATGVVTFDPDPGFTVNPTPLTYRLIENATNLFSDATVTANYNQLPPNAVNDVTPAVNPGATASVNLLTNDLLSDGSPATLAKVTVDIDPLTAGIQTSYNVPGKGNWVYTVATGVISFTPVAGYTIAPPPLDYRLIENATNLFDEATVTATYNAVNPDAVNDNNPVAAAPGNNVVINILANDLLSDGSPALPALVSVDLDPGLAGTQPTLIVPGQGTWSFDPATGILTFDPDPGFTINPTPLAYTLYENSTGLSDIATVIATYNQVPPNAVDDVTAAVDPGTLASVNLLTNDKLSDGSPATLAKVTVDLNPALAGIQTTYTAAGQGVWTYYPATGLISFDPDPGYTIAPAPLTYRLIENATNLFDDATVTAVYNQLPPQAVDDVVPAVNPGVNSSVNILTNDKLSDGSPALPTLVSVDLNAGTAGVQTTLVVANEGTWTYVPATGVLTFDPDPGFTINPTPLVYTLIENATGLVSTATVTANYNQLMPTAVNDVIPAVNPGVTASINLLANDKLSDGSPATLAKVTVDLNPSLAGIQTTYTVSGQGVWNYTVATGVISFTPNPGFTIDPTPLTYRLIENATNLFSDATVTAHYNLLPPIANDDTNPTPANPGTNVVLSILSNDLLSDGSPAQPSLVSVDLNAALAGNQEILVVAGQGTWAYNAATGALTFDPEPGFTVNPTVLTYTLIESATGLTNTALVTVTYNQLPPDAINDITPAENPGFVASVNLLTNDKLSDGSPATLGKVAVDLNPATPGEENSVTVAGKGTWQYDPTSGLITFTPVPGFTVAPPPLTYRLYELATNLFDDATVTAVYNLLPPTANDDSPVTVTLPGTNVNIDVLANDALSDGSQALPGLVSVDLNPSLVGVQTTYTAAGQGVWTYNAATGVVTFDPDPGFVISPTPITYILTETATGLTDNAVITAVFSVRPPTAVNDVTPAVNPGSVASVNILDNDKLSDNSPAVIGLVTVDLNPGTAGIQTTFTVTGEGTWSYAPLTGIISFTPVAGFTVDPTPITYRLIENLTTLYDEATVRAVYNQLPPLAVSDVTPTVNPGAVASVNLLTNDKLSDNSPATLNKVTVDLNPATPVIETSYPIAGQGTWSYNALTGIVSFTPVAGYTIAPAPLNYRLVENATGLFSDATVSAAYNALPPIANNDNPAAVQPGTTVSVNILANDFLSDNSPVLANLVTVDLAVDLDPATAGIQETLVLPGQGIWTYDSATGVLTFDPEPGFVLSPTPLVYTLIENLTGLSDVGTVTLIYNQVPPTANDDVTTAVNPGTLASVIALNNDLLSDGSPATISKTTVDMDLVTAGIQTTLTVAGQGLWTYYPASGIISFQPEPGYTIDPTPLTYRLIENATGLFDDATVRAVYNLVNPTANDDDTPIVNPGVPASINALTNDKLSDGSPATANKVTVDLNPGVAGTQTTFVVAGQGTWTYNIGTGLITFTPEVGFTIDPTPITYVLTENATSLSDDAIVTAHYNQLMPLAVNDVIAAVNPGVNASVNLLTNDKLSDGSPATLAKVTVDLNPALAGIQTTFTVAGEGTWTYTVGTGVVTFDPETGFTIDPTPLTYRLIENATTLFSDATVTAVYNPVNPIANDDTTPTLTVPGNNVIINILTNDKLSDGSQAQPTFVTVDLNPALAGTQTILTVLGEGTWTYDPATGLLTFAPEPDFLIDPTPIVYTLTETITGLTDNATVTVTVNDPPIAVNNAYTTDEDVTLNVPVNGILNNDSDTDTPAAQLTVSVVTTTPNGTLTLNPNGSFTYVPKANFNGTDVFTYRVSDGVSFSNTATVTITVNAVDDILSLLPKVYLQGALFGVSGPLMRDDLRVKGLLPLASPYASLNPTMGPASENVNSSAVFNAASDADDIVDWVFVELRDSHDSTSVVFSRSALLQRDGDIVDVNGTSPVQFIVAEPDTFYVAIRHRNHLGVMTATARPLSAVSTTIDFRQPSTPTYAKSNSAIHQAQVVVDQGRALWAGNALADRMIVYQGTNNDVNMIYNQIISAPGNQLFLLPNYILKGYFTGDIDMNGDVIFQGTLNDVEFIYQNVIKNHPGNLAPFSPTPEQPNFIIQEQLPY
ncbi:MAG: Ig-like domain-containing protein [Spirosomataceae bacterium]